MWWGTAIGWYLQETEFSSNYIRYNKKQKEIFFGCPNRS